MNATVEYTDGRRQERPKAPLFTCRSDKAVHALKYWLRNLAPWNEVNATGEDRLGCPIVKIGWNDGVRWEMSGVIVCDSNERRSTALNVVAKEQRRRERESENG